MVGRKDVKEGECGKGRMKGAEGAEGEEGELELPPDGGDLESEEDDGGLSLSAMEEALKPTVLETFDATGGVGASGLDFFAAGGGGAAAPEDRRYQTAPSGRTPARWIDPAGWSSRSRAPL